MSLSEIRASISTTATGFNRASLVYHALTCRAWRHSPRATGNTTPKVKFHCSTEEAPVCDLALPPPHLMCQSYGHLCCTSVTGRAPMAEDFILESPPLAPLRETFSSYKAASKIQGWWRLCGVASIIPLASAFVRALEESS